MKFTYHSEWFKENGTWQSWNISEFLTPEAAHAAAEARILELGWSKETKFRITGKSETFSIVAREREELRGRLNNVRAEIETVEPAPLRYSVLSDLDAIQKALGL